MNDRLNELLREIKELEKNIQTEMRHKEEKLRYTMRNGRVLFDREIAEIHRRLSTSSLAYIFRGSFLNMLSAPVIYALILPAVLLDLSVWIYQGLCFPIYAIPKVRRRDHFILDRHYLKYLSFMERLNCDYCSYFNGLVSYTAEIAARSEQYWCPIKHASAAAARHSRYHYFTDYGDAESYRAQLESIRKKYDDLA